MNNDLTPSQGNGDSRPYDYAAGSVGYGFLSRVDSVLSKGECEYVEFDYLCDDVHSKLLFSLVESYLSTLKLHYDKLDRSLCVRCMKDLTRIFKDSHWLSQDHNESLDFLSIRAELHTALEVLHKYGNFNESEAEELKNTLKNNFSQQLRAWPEDYRRIKECSPEGWNDVPFHTEIWYSAYKGICAEVSSTQEWGRFSLEDVYVELDGAVLRVDHENKIAEEPFVESVSLRQNVLNWIESENEDYIYGIKGESGGGKTAFCKMLIAHHGTELYRKGISVFHVSVKGLKITDGVEGGLERYFTEVFQGTYEDFQSKYWQGEKVILLIDGLEHVSISLHSSHAAIRHFVSSLKRICQSANSSVGGAKLRVVLTGVPEAISLLEGTAAILSRKNIVEILPFAPNGLNEGNLEQNLVVKDLRVEWAEKWESAVGKQFPSVALEIGALSAGNFGVRSTYCYVISHALLYTELKFTKDTNIEDVYNAILASSLTESFLPEGCSQKEIYLCLEEIAIWSWEGTGFGEVESELEQRLMHSPQLTWLLGSSIQKKLVHFVFKLIQHEYYTQHKGHWGTVFRKFLLIDFLVAKRIIRVVEKLYFDVNRKGKEKAKGCLLTMSEQALHWTKQTSGIEMTETLFVVLRSLLKIYFETLEKDEQIRAQCELSSLFAYILTKGSPIDEVKGYKKYDEMNYGAYNSETVMIVTLGGMGQVTHRVSTVKWDENDPLVIGSWLMKMAGQRVDSMSYDGEKVGFNRVTASYTMRSLQYLNFSNQILDVQNLTSAILEGSVMTKVSLNGSSLRYANLENAQIGGSEICQVSLNYANLKRANLENSTLTNSLLTGVTMEEANCVNAVFDNSNLSLANLTRAALSWASMQEVTFKSAVLNEARFNGAILDYSNFHEASLKKCVIENASVKFVRFSSCEMQEASFVASDLGQGLFKDCNMENACFYQAEMAHSEYQNCCLKKSNLEGANLSLTVFQQCDFTGASFNRAILRNTSFSNNSSLHGASLSYAQIENVTFNVVDFGMATFEGAVFSGSTVLIQCQLNGADFNGVDLRKVKLSGNSFKGATLIDARMEECDLSSTVFTKAVMDRANMRQVKMHSADLEKASMFRTVLENANLTKANLKQVNLHGANLRNAELVNADLESATLFGADLTGANLKGANLKGASLFGANFDDAELYQDQVDDLQLHQMKGIPNWIFDDKLASAFQGKHKSASSIEIIEVRKSTLNVSGEEITLGETVTVVNGNDKEEVEK